MSGSGPDSTQHEFLGEAEDMLHDLTVKLNDLESERPMVWVNEICWNEMNIDDELTPTCTDPICRGFEEPLRRILYQWKHCPVDMVVEPFVRVPKAIENSGFGVEVQQRLNLFPEGLHAFEVSQNTDGDEVAHR